MEQSKIFISVGGTSNTEQETFVKAVEDRLTSENLLPNTVGRNKFSADAPLKAVKELMDEGSGLIVIALERTYYENGLESRGGNKEKVLQNIKYTTPWNQIEAGMAYVKGLPILVIIEDGIKIEGLLENGYDWYVLTVQPNQSSLSTKEFNGVLSSWKEKVEKYKEDKQRSIKINSLINPEELTLGQIFRNLKASHLWSIILVLVAIATAGFLIGKFFSAM
ncbi:MAG: hypothetical protein J6O88_19330 [Chryseobacterium sp.]|uniref:hypothetical protein n=1 Tax=Chryseobacterium sp. TaxID=1871047 RepID=UPI001B2133D4|nr:hypothetical protein [Chryseobacterium sp.]MBO6186807.1 hypothetical protein [Chryseobacterium sp.]